MISFSLLLAFGMRVPELSCEMSVDEQSTFFVVPQNAIVAAECEKPNT